MQATGITLFCSVCKNHNYRKRKNKKSVTEKLAINKYCNKCQKNTLHKETK